MNGQRYRAVQALLLLIAVCSLVMVGNGLRGVRVTGRAAPDPMLLPAVGDCVDSPLSDGGLLPWAPYHRCGAGPDVIGEVAAVLPNEAPAPAAAVEARQRALENCRLATVGYVGSIAPVVDLGDGSRPLVWDSLVTVGAVLLGPGPTQRAAGARWVACVVGAPDGVSYQGRVANLLLGRALPAPFGACYKSTNPSDDARVPCTTPHRLELLATAQTDLLPAATVRASCLVYARRALRTEDLSRAGRLSVGVFAPHPSIYTVSSCAVTYLGSRALVSSVVGLGTAALPEG